MGVPSRLQSDLYVDGVLSARTLIPSIGSVSNAQVAAGVPGGYVDASKMQHQVKHVYAQPNAPAVTERKTIYRACGGTGTIQSLYLGSIVAATGTGKATVDIQKNGTTILSAPINVDNTYTARVGNGVVPAVTAYVLGDEFEAVISSTPTFLNPPASPATLTTATTGGSMAAGTYAVGYSYYNAAGETTLSPTNLIVVPAGTSTNTITITTPTLPTGATGINVYLLTNAAGSMKVGTAASNTVTITSATGSAAIPTSNTTGNTLPTGLFVQFFANEDPQ